ncbi:MAG: nucleotidyltransferase domain-containing protein [Chloroflexi bacterium]|nr:nucleotidyltransferase domain-containing protein [Chloroflexota bacterium]MCL5074734.1 nucleotidyltransferase domain-containing protein [Chloroflexota bacterium]
MATQTKAYQKSIEQLKREILSRIGDRIDSIVLYGSAARGEYRPLESDIDILVIAEDDNSSLKAEISSVIGEIDLRNATATSLVYLSRSNFRSYLGWGSPLLESVLEEGVILYDNGTFELVRRSLVKASK